MNGSGNLLWSLSHIGLQPGTETIESICAAMPNHSLLILQISVDNNLTEYPDSYGTLIVWKIHPHRINLEFKGANINRKFMGTCYDGSFTGWVELATV